MAGDEVQLGFGVVAYVTAESGSSVCLRGSSAQGSVTGADTRVASI